MQNRASVRSILRPRDPVLLVSLSILLLAAGCRSSSPKDAEPVPTGRLVQDAVSLYEMGRQLELHGNYASAVDRYSESIRLSPRPVAHYALGSLLAELRRFDAARENLRRAIELAPGFADARRELERVEAVEQLIARGEPIPESFRIKPAPPSLSGEEPDSATAIRPATPTVSPAPPPPPKPKSESPPPAPIPAPGLVRPPTAESEPPDLTAQEPGPPVEKLSEKEEARVRAFLREGAILLDGGHLDEALRLYQDALLEFPREGRLHYNLGYTHQRAGNYRAAFLAYEDALRFGFASAGLSNNLGVVYENLGHSRLAGNAYRKAIEQGGLADAHYNLAVLLEKRGELDEALREFEAFLALDPAGEFAERARARAERLRRRVR